MNTNLTRGDPWLRAALDELEGIPIGEHQQRIREIGRRIPHTITFLASEGLLSDGAPCAPYALGFSAHPNFWTIIHSTQVHARAPFVNWLLPRLEEQSAATPGALVLYFDGDKWTHMGTITQSGRVVSKSRSEKLLSRRNQL
jgi:hypothetical protein